VDTPTACQSRPGQGPDRPSRPDRHAGPRGQEAGYDHLGGHRGTPGGARGVPCGREPATTAGELARSEQPDDRLAAGHPGSASA